MHFHAFSIPRSWPGNRAASSIKHARQGNQVGKRDNPEACAHSFHQLLVTIDKKKRSSGISGIECIPEIVEYIQEQI